MGLGAALLACAPAAPPVTEVTARGLHGWSDALATMAPPRLAPLVAEPDAPARTAPAFDARYLGHLAPGDSLSIGTTGQGYVVGARALESGPGLALRPLTRDRGTMWGTASFVDALARAARHVAERYPGSVLYVGDLGLRDGGTLPPHRSHTSGRDVDLCYYTRAPDGTPADGPGMSWVDAAGRVTGRDAIFDAERNWALVEALLRDPSIQVQWVFVASHLEPLLLAAGRDAGADATLLARAAKVLQQPNDSSPHADHFHVRVYCGAAERVEGCLDAAPFYPWIDTHDDEVARWVAGLVPFLSDPRGAAGEEFRFAVERLVRANARDALPSLEQIALRTDADPATRALVSDAIDFLRGRRTPAAWARWRAVDLGD